MYEYKNYSRTVSFNIEGMPKCYIRIRGKSPHWRKYNRNVKNGKTEIDVMLFNLEMASALMRKALCEELYT